MQPKLIFITGAGSSGPYGFPTGFQLKQEIIKICETCNYNDLVPSIFDTNMKRNLPFGEEPDFLKQLAKRLRTSSHSIDAFCYEENNPKIISIAKTIAGYILQECTKKYKSADRFEEDWLQNLFDNITRFAQKNSLRPGSLSFITFNYDCVIEYKIEEMVERHISLANENIVDFFQSISIDHVYGKLNHQLPSNEFLRLKEYSSGILLMKEGNNLLNSQNSLDKYYDFFEQTERIFFLGFGFDLLNLSAIGLPNILDESHIGRPNISKMYETTSKVSNINELSKFKSRFPKFRTIEPGLGCSDLINKFSDAIQDLTKF